MMKVLWAPWRMEYISSGGKEKRCIFCPGQDRSHDEERLILRIERQSILLMNRFPYSNGHLLIAPLRHVSSMDGMSSEETLEIMTMISKAIAALKTVMDPEGFNIGLNIGKAAGAGVEDHIHFHIVPRWNGDTNFMTICGETRVIPEHIQTTYRKLLPFFK